jgi:hypothetical protein
MRLVSVGKAALTISTGFGLRDFLKRHKTAAWIIVALVIANEIRGMAVVYAILRQWGWFA